MWHSWYKQRSIWASHEQARLGCVCARVLLCPRTVASVRQRGRERARDGEILKTGTGGPKTDAQPPFLLRYSPHLFAREAPEVFEWCEKTNRLSLREGRSPPWIHVFTDSARTNRTHTWLYCAFLRDGKPCRELVCFAWAPRVSLLPLTLLRR